MTTYSFNSGPNNNGSTFLTFGNGVDTINQNVGPAVAVGTRVANSGNSHLPFSGDGVSAPYFGEIQSFGQVALIAGVATNPLAKAGFSTNPDGTRAVTTSRHYPITSIDYESGAVTWGSGVGEAYVMVADTGSTYIDNVYSVASAPYSTPANLTYLGSLTPSTVQYRTRS